MMRGLPRYLGKNNESVSLIYACIYFFVSYLVTLPVTLLRFRTITYLDEVSTKHQALLFIRYHTSIIVLFLKSSADVAARNVMLSVTLPGHSSLRVNYFT